MRTYLPVFLSLPQSNCTWKFYIWVRPKTQFKIKSKFIPGQSAVILDYSSPRFLPTGKLSSTSICVLCAKKMFICILFLQFILPTTKYTIPSMEILIYMVSDILVDSSVFKYIFANRLKTFLFSKRKQILKVLNSVPLHPIPYLFPIYPWKKNKLHLFTQIIQTYSFEIRLSLLVQRNLHLLVLPGWMAFSPPLASIWPAGLPHEIVP